MAVQKLKGRRTVSLVINVLIFQVVLSASLHCCFAEIGHGQPPRNTSTLHPTDVNTFGSSVYLPVSGNVYPHGLYTVTVEIGNPPKKYQLDIDTGSNYPWVQCDDPCAGCKLPRERRYKPNPNNYVLCKDPICSAFQSSNPPQCSRNPKEKCSFEVEYADQSSVLGVVVSDSFHLPLVSGTVSYPRMAFGCAYELKNFGPDSPLASTFAGVLGLGRGKASISTQLRTLGVSQNIVGHCFHDKGGFLSFGADFIPKSGMVWATMSQSSSVDHYILGPAEVFFRERPTGIKGFNVIFDTGATYTYLNSGVYKSVLNLIRRDLIGKPLKPVEEEDLPICWKGPFTSVRDVQNYFGILALSFSGSSNIQLQLPPEAYLIVTERRNVCLGILNGSGAKLEETLNIIGDISMLGKLIVYDNENHRIGWASADCTRKFG